MDCCQADVAAAGAVLAVALEMSQERADQRRIEFRHRQVRGRLAQALLCILQQQTEGIAIAGDGVRTGVALLHQPIHEERLQQSGKRAGGAHGRLPCLERSTCRSA